MSHMDATEDAAARRPARPGGTRLHCETSSNSFYEYCERQSCIRITRPALRDAGIVRDGGAVRMRR
ncbi:hypothetical protein BH20ACT13_BH20ACT13_18700 [soil metagenome]